MTPLHGFKGWGTGDRRDLAMCYCGRGFPDTYGTVRAIEQCKKHAAEEEAQGQLEFGGATKEATQ